MTFTSFVDDLSFYETNLAAIKELYSKLKNDTQDTFGVGGKIVAYLSAFYDVLQPRRLKSLSIQAINKVAIQGVQR